jgi:hypothetical protein
MHTNSLGRSGHETSMPAVDLTYQVVAGSQCLRKPNVAGSEGGAVRMDHTGW